MGKLAKILTAVTAALLLAACSDIMSDLKTRSSAGTPVSIPEQEPDTSLTPTPPTPEALATPLTLEAAVAGAVVTFDNKAAGPVTYKVNGGTAQTIASYAKGTITLANIGDKVEFFGDNETYATSRSNYSNIACSEDCYVYGNIMSLIKSQGFKDAAELKESYAFCSLFSSNTHIKNKDGADLLLPAATLAYECYYYMFCGCTSLTAAPSLPAATLANSCYNGMFYNCSSLTAAPSLPAATLANSCYNVMFYNCTSLKTAPSLPATTLANRCYGGMFYGCTSLTAAPSLPAATLAIYCYDIMFYGCTSLKAAPSLPATTLVEGCYGNMFSGCASLASVTCLATNISAIGCTTNWLYGVAANGTFTKADGMTGWTTGENGIPNGWTVVDKQ